MDIKEMKTMKKALGLTLEDISKKSGVPLSTVQKIFAGVTANPRAETMELLENVLAKERADNYYYSDFDKGNAAVREANLLDMYQAVSGTQESLRLRQSSRSAGSTFPKCAQNSSLTVWKPSTERSGR